MIDRLPADIFQILIAVEYVEKTAGELAAVFGVDLPTAVLLDPPEVAHAVYRGKPTKTRAKVIPFLNPGAVDIELIQPDGEPSIWKEFLERYGEGISHIGVQVANLEEAVAFMEGKGYRVAHRASFAGGCYAIMDTRERLAVNLMLKQLDRKPEAAPPR
jgi:methylmalonyl-CoA/ethylmalonyl-CoA epimerase